MTQPPTEKEAAASPRRLLFLDRAVQLLGTFSGLLVAAMMFLTFFDVTGRKFLNSPIFGSFELTEVLMGLVIFAGLPLATLRKENIAVSLLTDALAPPQRRIQGLFMHVLGAVVTGVMAWRMWAFGERLVRVGETTLELQISKGLIAQTMAVLLAVTSAVFVLQFLRDLSRH